MNKEGEGQKSEVRREEQRAEDRRQKTEGSGQRAEDEQQMGDGGRRKAEGRRKAQSRGTGARNCAVNPVRSDQIRLDPAWEQSTDGTNYTDCTSGVIEFHPAQSDPIRPEPVNPTV